MDIPTNLLPTRLTRGPGYQLGQYFILAERGVTPEMVVNPDYWLHLASKIHVHDVFTVVAGDGSFDMDVRIADVDPRGLYARVRVLRACDGDGNPLNIFSPAVPKAPPPVGMPSHDGYVIEPDAKGWRVMRGNDLIAGNLPSEAAAIQARDDSRAGKQIKRQAA